MNNNKIFNKLSFLLDIQPELYSDKPNRYQIRNKQYGLYPIKEAKIICEFLRCYSLDLIMNSINK